VIGLGAQDSLDQARDFARDYGTTFTMVWDPTFESWANLGIALQPAAVLIAPDGTRLGRWSGMFDEDEVLELARGSAAAVDRTASSSGFCRYSARYVTAAEALRGVDDVPVSDRGRVFDDIRFASTAMAQTAPKEHATAVRAFSDSVAALAANAVLHEFNLETARANGYDQLAATVQATTQRVAPTVADLCDISLTQ
jgi:hypothetical protein